MKFSLKYICIYIVCVLDKELLWVLFELFLEYVMTFSADSI